MCLALDKSGALRASLTCLRKVSVTLRSRVKGHVLPYWARADTSRKPESLFPRKNVMPVTNLVIPKSVDQVPSRQKSTVSVCWEDLCGTSCSLVCSADFGHGTAAGTASVLAVC